MRVTFFGAARTVTGSMHLVEVAGKRVLLDCGLYQGRRKNAFERNRDLPFDAGSLEAVVLSHAHLDHCGNLPSLIRAGFGGRIYGTAATLDLAERMLLDSAHIQSSDVAYVNKRRRQQGKRLFEPLYVERDVAKTIKCFEPIPYDEWFAPADGFRARFLDAGHILGSASVTLDLTESERTRRLVFSGDIGRKGMPILRDPRVDDGVDYVIMESTYGNRLHEEATSAEEKLREEVQATVDRNGKLLIPTFAVGRTQEVVYHLNRLWETRRLPIISAFVDSPLASDVTEIFRRHPECYDAAARTAVFSDSDHDPFGFRRLRYVQDVRESKQLATFAEPAIIIAASGMCEAGRILHHLKRYLGESSTTVLFVGYQAEQTLGRKLLDGAERVSIFGAEVPVHARIVRADSYSAHADQAELLDWTAKTRAGGKVARIFLVHGEPSASFALADKLRGDGVLRVDVPERGQSFDLD